jgi:hypothetical protein
MAGGPQRNTYKQRRTYLTYVRRYSIYKKRELAQCEHEQNAKINKLNAIGANTKRELINKNNTTANTIRGDLN